MSNLLIVHTLVIPRCHGFVGEPLALVLEAGFLLLLDVLRDFK